MKRLSILLLLSVALSATAVERVTYEELQNGGWQRLRGQIVQITTPLVVCGTFYDSIMLAPERLYVPEERAVGLADGDSTDYFRLAKLNALTRIRLQCASQYDLNLGATVKGLTARITGERELQTGKRPSFNNYRPEKKLPSLGDADIIVCSANIQNYFYHQGGYATKRNTLGQHALQCYKVASALTAINANLYALCELEKGEAAPAELTAKMNELTRSDRYEFVRTGTTDGDTISVGFVYNRLTLRPFGELRFAYPDTSIYCCRFMLQGFEQTATGKRFVVSLNHLRSKRGTQEESLLKRMNNINALLNCIGEAYADSTYTDPDILMVGDFNSYTQELPLQAIVRAGYTDMLMRFDSLGYSYSYKGECGYLDRAYASPTMAEQVTGVHPLHWNTDYYYSAAYYSKYNYKNNLIPKEAPKDIRKIMSSAAKKNLLFRYADHDPILIGLKLH